MSDVPVDPPPDPTPPPPDQGEDFDTSGTYDPVDADAYPEPGAEVRSDEDTAKAEDREDPVPSPGHEEEQPEGA